MDCPAQNTLLAFLSQSTTRGEAARIQRHIKRCQRCRRALHALVQGVTSQAARATAADGWERDTEINVAPPAGVEPDRAPTEPRAAPPQLPTMCEPGSDTALMAAGEGDEEPVLVFDRSSTMQPGQIVDHFKIMRLLGRGGMGEVYLARDSQLGRKVALKIIHRRMARSPALVQRFLFEARATARFNHPNIVAIHAVGDHQGQPYVALEYLQGQTLSDRIAGGPLRPRQTARIGLAVADALREAHSRNLLHRDLKPGNILICRDGRICVLDFGLAKVIQTPPTPRETEELGLQPVDSGLTPLQTEGMGLQGTPAYMAPEQWRSEPTTEATDVFAMGLLLYEMLAGELPFECNDRQQLSSYITSAEPIAIPAGELGIPAALSGLIAGCLEKEPAARPTASDVALELESYISIRTSRPETSERCPFRGLLPFAEAHVEFFFGRAGEIAALSERLREEATLAVVGPSGSGKSSLIRAGLIPRLGEQGAWTVLQLQPGTNPFAALASCLLQRVDRPPRKMKLSGLVDLRAAVGDVESQPGAPNEQEQQRCAEQLRQSPGTLAVILRRLAEEQSTRVLLHVDQLEELYTLVQDEQERALFLEAICAAADDAGDPVRVILAVRDDFLYRLAETGGMHEVLGRVMLLRSPDRRMLEQILVRPLDLAGYRYDDPRLVGRMVRAVQGEQSCLPLLQFTARQLWERRDRDRKLIHNAAYEQIGGVEGALANHADAVLESLPAPRRELARKVLLRLVTAEGTRQVLSRDQALEGTGPAAAEVLDHFVRARLVATRKAYGRDHAEPDLELVHESLIANWGRLRRWVEESREELRFLSEVSQAARLWQQRGRRPGEVWQGKALDEALAARRRCSAELPAVAVEFIEAGQQRRRFKGRRRRWLMMASFALLALASLVFATKECETRHQKERAEGQRADARREGARAALARGNVLEARAKLRLSLQTRDATLARLLWWRLSRVPLLWRRDMGNTIYNVDYSPDGKLLAASRENRTLFLFDRQTAAVRRVLRGFSSELHALAFSPNGKYLATGCIDGEVRLWDARSGKPLHVLSGLTTHVWTVRFSPDGRYLTAGSYDPLVHIWEVSSGKIHKVLRGHKKMVVGVAFSPDGRRLATGSGDHAVRIWDLRSGRLEQAFLGHRELVGSVAFSAGGELLVSGSADRTVRIWDLRSGRQKLLLRGHTGRIYAVDISPDGELVASGGFDGDVRLWSVASGKQLRVLRGHTAPVYDVRFAPDGRHLGSAGGDGRVLQWMVGGTRQKLPSEGHTKRVTDVCFAPGGELLATAGDDHTVRLWERASGRQLRVLRGHTARVFSVRFAPGGRLLASASGDGSVRLWEVHSGQLKRALRGHTGRVFSVRFSPDGARLASGGEDHTARIWSVASGRPERILRGHSNKVFGVDFDPAGLRLATASQDRTVRLWQLRSGAMELELRGHEGPVYSVNFAPNGEQLLSGCYNGRLRLWDLSRGTSRDLGGQPRRIVWSAFHPGGQKVGVVDRQGRAQILNLRSGEARQLRGHRGGVGALAFSRDGALVATASDDSTVRLWDAGNGRPLWRAPILLGSPPALASHRGWTRLRRSSMAPAAHSRWREKLMRQASLAHHDAGLLCMITRDGQLQAWERTTDRMLFSTLVPGAAQVQALRREGCLVRARGQVVLHGRSGNRRVLSHQAASAMALYGQRVLVATGRKVVSLSPSGGQPRKVLEVTAEVSAMARSPGWLVLGYDYGNMELVALGPQKVRSRLMARGTPASPVVRVLLTPHDTLVAGFANGLLGIWDLGTGQLLETSQLHGPVKHLLLEENRLYAASELGSHLSWDLSVLFQDYCGLLRQVWRKVPVVWQHGLPVARKPPADHRCSELQRPGEQRP